jgi:hypothetical protein
VTSLQNGADPSGDRIESSAGCSPLTGIEVETIPGIAGENVQMNVKNLLTGGLAISEKQVHSLASQTAAPNSCGQALRNHEHPTTVGLVQVGEPDPVDLRNDQQVAQVHRIQVAEGKQSIILVDDAGIRSAGNDAAEHTIHTGSFAHHSSSTS